MVGTSGPEQLGLIKFPASALDITPVLQMRKLPHSPWADLFEINNAFLSAFLSHLHMLSLCCRCLTFMSTSTYWSSWLVCFKGSNSTHPNWNSAFVQDGPPPDFSVPAAGISSTSVLTLQVWEFLGFFLIPHPAIRINQSCPLGLWIYLELLSVSLSLLPTYVNRHHLLHFQCLLHTVVRWPFINKSECVTFFYRSFFYESNLGFT